MYKAAIKKTPKLKVKIKAEGKTALNLLKKLGVPHDSSPTDRN